MSTLRAWSSFDKLELIFTSMKSDDDGGHGTEPLMLFKGWLPVDDEVNDVDRPSLRVTLETLVLEAFIQGVLDAE